jgi:hypothetical protein
MNQRLKKYLNDQAQAIDDEMKQALVLCDGDPMRALRVVLIANSFLLEENESLKRKVSVGYARGKMPSRPDRPTGDDDNQR